MISYSPDINIGIETISFNEFDLHFQKCLEADHLSGETFKDFKD